MSHFKAYLLLPILASINSAAMGATYLVTLSKTNYANPPGGAFTLTFTGVPVPTGGGTLKVRANGDLDLASEYLDVSMEGIQFGPLFNNDPDDDRFDNAGIQDKVLQPNTNVSSTAIVFFSELQTVTANGSVNVTIAPSANVGDASFIEVTLSYPYAATGACCISFSQTCQDLNPTDCGTQGGTYAGDGTSCATYVCFPKGACCLPNGTCTGDQVSPDTCAGLGGTFQGNASTCATSDCRLKGSCCVAGVCTLKVSQDCATLGGTYGGDNTTCGGDADGDGVPDACDQCAGTVAGVSVDTNGCPPLIRGDFDRDGDVDLADYTAFKNCSTGPRIPRGAGCTRMDFDGDVDVDADDFGVFQRCFSGENQPAPVSCYE